MDVRDFCAANAGEFSQALREWLAIPSVSADPARHGDVRRSAEWLGLAEAEITLSGPARDLHSGSFGGGVPNPAHALAALLAGLHDADGKVTLPGFYDDVLPLSGEERELLAKLVATVTGGHGVRPCRSPIGSPAVAAARRAMARAFGRDVLFTKEGGSGPEADLADILGAPLVFVAVGLDADRIHAPNEFVDLSRLLRGAETAAYLWEELAAAGTAAR